MVSTSSINRQSLVKIVQRASAVVVKCEIVVFVLYRTDIGPICTKFEADSSIPSKVRKGSQNFEIGSRYQGHAHIWVVLARVAKNRARQHLCQAKGRSCLKTEGDELMRISACTARVVHHNVQLILLKLKIPLRKY